MELRWATPDDAELLTRLRLDMRRERETVLPPADMTAFEICTFEYFKSAISNGSYIGIIASVNGNTAATGGIVLHIHPPSYSVPNGKTACLLNMYTLPDFRKQGIAGKIVAALVEKAQSCGCCKVFLNASDMGKRVYQNFGFTDVTNEMVFDLK